MVCGLGDRTVVGIAMDLALKRAQVRGLLGMIVQEKVAHNLAGFERAGTVDG